ncbi:MAG: DmsE family decaheme c-type cytochrome [Candidatus Binataceae bacterium]
MEAERSSRKFWAGLFVALVAFGIAFAISSPAAIGAEGTLLSQATGSGTPLPPGYVHNDTCTSCHDVKVNAFRKTMMGHLMLARPRDQEESLACQSCHGPGREHIRHPSKPSPGFLSFRETSFKDIKIENERCLECHQNGERGFWQASTHAERGIRCVDCHAVMCPVTASALPQPQLKKSPLGTEFVNPFVVTRPETQVCLRCHLDKKMEINLPSHMPLREGLMTCTDCHNPHGGPYQKQLRAAMVNEVCYRCHAEKRGPFLWMHAPVAMNCLNCHVPHGSVNQHMLVINMPVLCQRCHIGSFHPSDPHKRGQIFVINQQCANCHSQIHGSNSPGGRYFTR